MGMPIPFPGLSLLLCGYARLREGGPPLANEPDAHPSTVAVIPALNEERTIPYAITSLARQTVPPDELVVVDDGSTDETGTIVTELADAVSFDVTLLRHDEPRGKTPGIKEVARGTDAEKIFVLDADTHLESPEYLERLQAAHATGADAGTTNSMGEDGNANGTAGDKQSTTADVPTTEERAATARQAVGCAFGQVRPLTRRDRSVILDRDVCELVDEESRTRQLLETARAVESSTLGRVRYLVGRWPVEQYRRTLYNVEQRFVKEGYMRLFGSAMFPAGCGVLYDREALVSVFDEYQESLGDDLTNSEDVFIGFALADRGLANVQVGDVSMRTTEPTLRRLPRQLYLWGSAYLQSAYYFQDLSTRLRSRGSSAEQTPGEDSAIEDESEPPSATGSEHGTSAEATDAGKSAAANKRPLSDAETDRTDPPFGRAVVAQLLDGLYPTTLLVLIVLAVVNVADPLVVILLLAIEFVLYAFTVTLTASRRLRALASFLVAIPVRLAQLPIGTYTYVRVGTDLLRGDRNWRK